jgi:hypothetical protein
MTADETRSTLPAEWAFVVHLRPGALPEEGRMAGRVEHVPSGRSVPFGSLPELVAFVGRTLRNLREDVKQGPLERSEVRERALGARDDATSSSQHRA